MNQNSRYQGNYIIKITVIFQKIEKSRNHPEALTGKEIYG